MHYVLPVVQWWVMDEMLMNYIEVNICIKVRMGRCN